MHAGVGLAASIAALAFTNIVMLLIVVALDREFATRDIGDVFDKAAAVLEYGDRKLRALAVGGSVPDPPALFADIVTLRVALATTIAYQLMAVGIVVAVVRRPVRTLIRDFGLHQYRGRSLWVPAGAAVGCYIMVGAYAFAADALGIDILIPESTVPTEILRDRWTTALTGVTATIGAPISEELFFRGLIFGGLLRWGFLPAAGISSLLFAAVHLDIGSLVPFTIIGLTLAWLYWRRGNLWDAIAFHVMFNAASFILLISTEA
ncbi:MAG: CPBP family intramembrane metalloprotease [Dehalococcoidia bacterium]